MQSKNELKEALRNASVEDELSIAILARDLVRSGVVLREDALNKQILSQLLANAKVDDPASLRKLCRELVTQGYAPAQPLKSQFNNLLVINPLKIIPTVVGQMPGKGWAFMWELDRDCEDLNWLVGSHISVDGKIYVVQGIENMPEKLQKGEKLTLLCSALPLD
ncbi:MAG: hypothetical protein WC966_05810 [Bradymonadales bacterium]|jgi:hypothetical protein